MVKRRQNQSELAVRLLDLVGERELAEVVDRGGRRLLVAVLLVGRLDHLPDVVRELLVAGLRLVDPALLVQAEDLGRDISAPLAVDVVVVVEHRADDDEHLGREHVIPLLDGDGCWMIVDSAYQVQRLNRNFSIWTWGRGEQSYGWYDCSPAPGTPLAGLRLAVTTRGAGRWPPRRARRRAGSWRRARWSGGGDRCRRGGAPWSGPRGCCR